jgi:hypothetical protein
VRTFGRASALHPVPLTRKVAHAPASASFALFAEVSFRSCVLKWGRAKLGATKFAEVPSCPHEETVRAGVKQISLFAAGAGPFEPLRLHAERARTRTRLRMSEIYSL